SRLLSGEAVDISEAALAGFALEKLKALSSPSIVRVVNATGTVLHTNLGRAVLCSDAIEAAALSASNPVNLEFDISTGKRDERDLRVSALINRLTGAEDSSVVNNNAAAVLITLNTLAEGKEVIISRGELIEIGGSFRLPDVIKKSGCVMKEVGTTNRTHASDYSDAITPQTALLLKAHTSNYTISGFTSEVSLKELVTIGKKSGIPVVEDLGSGTLVDLREYGLPYEPVVSESIAAGADIVTFSGDKLLGGPQAGIIAGKKHIIEKIRSNPLKRALRADKLTLSALEATLRLYLNKETLAQKLPVLRAMTKPLEEIEANAVMAADMLKKSLGHGFTVEVTDSESVVGGGSLPGRNLATKVVRLTHKTIRPDEIYMMFLRASPPVVGRVSNDSFLLDLRTVDRPEDVVVKLK
ncbi:MAG: L-seryl-tRNA(Sec) selenium transferase, partial [Deltaproteobacteria bacterium]|nr:L-seryl-tRNA(Sec) selenium transferase [Deltaproteobacteria bacterium]